MRKDQKYHGQQLKDVYSFLLEGDFESSTFSTILKMPIDRLQNYLKNLKTSQPFLYGRLVFKAYANEASRHKIVQAINSR